MPRPQPETVKPEKPKPKTVTPLTEQFFRDRHWDEYPTASPTFETFVRSKPVRVQQIDGEWRWRTWWSHGGAPFPEQPQTVEDALAFIDLRDAEIGKAQLRELRRQRGLLEESGDGDGGGECGGSTDPAA